MRIQVVVVIRTTCGTATICTQLVLQPHFFAGRSVDLGTPGVLHVLQGIFMWLHTLFVRDRPKFTEYLGLKKVFASFILIEKKVFAPLFFLKKVFATFFFLKKLLAPLFIASPNCQKSWITKNGRVSYITACYKTEIPHFSTVFLSLNWTVRKSKWFKSNHGLLKVFK